MAMVCGWECLVIRLVQRLTTLRPALYAITVLGDPSASIVYAFAAQYWWSLSPMDVAAALHFVGVAVTADYLNNGLKYALQGDRPFWTDPQYTQVDLTCETGYGNPSGHVMVSAAAWGFLCLQSRSTRVRTVWVLLLSLVALSRVHLAAHFPHQIVLGLGLGFSLAFLQSLFATAPHRRPSWVRPLAPCHVAGWLARGPRSAALGSAGAVLLYTALFRILSWLGRDPLGSVAKARAACRAGEAGLGATTSPLQGLVRDVTFVTLLALFHHLLNAEGAASRDTPSTAVRLLASGAGGTGLLALKQAARGWAPPQGCAAGIGPDLCDALPTALLYGAFALWIALVPRLLRAAVVTAPSPTAHRP